MNKKIFAIIAVSIFLLSAISFVSAQETSDSGNTVSHSFSVKINWDDNGQTNARPDSIKVDLMKNGKVIDTKTLTKSNSWSVTFNVAEEGNFAVKEVTKLSGYSSTVKNGPNNEFEIKYTLKDNTSNEPQDADSAENTLTAIVIEESVVDNNNETQNSTDNNATNNTNNNTNNTPTTNNATNNTNIINNTTNITPVNNNTDINNTTNNTPIKNHTTKIIPKKEDKKPIITKTKLMQAGIPIMVLIVAIVIAIIARREK